MRWRIRLAAIAVLAAISMSSGIATAQVPQSLNYQGYLTDAGGQALEDSVVVQFAIYTTDTGGTPLWTDIQSVFPAQGLFTTTLGGAGNPFPAGLFDTPLYLGVQVSTDDEMTPRTALKASAFTMKALDSETLGGLTSADLDQSADVATLNSDLGSTQSDVADLTGVVGSNSSLVQTAQNSILALNSDVATVASDVAGLQSSIADVQSDLILVENTLPTKQNEITGFCDPGTFITDINSNGSVDCGLDTAGPWSFFDDVSLEFGVSVGIGTPIPTAALHIEAPADTDALRARVGGSTKLMIHENGSTSIGSTSVGPQNGLYVAQQAGIGTTVPNARLTTADPDWQLQLRNNGAGGTSWYMGASADAWAVGSNKFVLNSTNSPSGAAFVIDGEKNVGIGNTSPSTRLHIGGGSDVSPTGGGYVTFGSNNSSNVAIDNNEIMSRNNGAVAPLTLNAEGGEVRINTNGSRDEDALEVQGRVVFDVAEDGGFRMKASGTTPTFTIFEPTSFEEGWLGTFSRPFSRMYSRAFYAQSSLDYNTYSDRSLKTNVAAIKDPIAIVNALEGVTYEMLKSPMGERARGLTPQEQFVNDNQIGFIAQDVAEVLPQLVTEDETSGLQTVAYMGVIPVLVEAIKEQQRQLDAQRAEIDELRSTLQ